VKTLYFSHSVYLYVRVVIKINLRYILYTPFIEWPSRRKHTVFSHKYETRFQIKWSFNLVFESLTQCRGTLFLTGSFNPFRHND